MSKQPNKESKILSPGIKINVKCVETCDEIPNSPIYWVKSTNQFAIHVNGVIMRGNIGNVFDFKSDGRNLGTSIYLCKHKNKCKFLLNNQKCKFFHDPMDVKKLYESSAIDETTFEDYKHSFRNFTSISWLYVGNNYKKKKNMRFLGNRNTLMNDIFMAKFRPDSWVDDYMDQTFHDFLVIMALNQQGTLKNYPDVNMISTDYIES